MRDAAVCGEAALDIATRQKARMLLLRAATDLARRGAPSADARDGRQVLREVLESLDEGLETVDVRAATALMGIDVATV